MGQGKIDFAFAMICMLGLCFIMPLTGRLNIAVYPAPVLIKGAMILLLLLLIAIYGRRDPRIARVARVVFWAAVFTCLFELPIYFMFRLALPFRDAALASADQLIGIQVPRVILYMDRFPVLREIVGYVYNSLIFLIALALLLPAILGQIDKNNEFLLGIIFCILGTLITLSFFQAIGPWVSYRQITATSAQHSAASMLYKLKAGEPVVFDLGYPAPLVALPSWHSIFAVLSAIALARVRIIRWAAALWTALILFSCVTTGWHYTTDILAGAGMSLMAAYCAHSFLLWFCTPTRSEIPSPQPALCDRADYPEKATIPADHA